MKAKEVICPHCQFNLGEHKMLHKFSRKGIRLICPDCGFDYGLRIEWPFVLFILVVGFLFEALNFEAYFSGISYFLVDILFCVILVIAFGYLNMKWLLKWGFFEIIENDKFI